MTIAMITDYLMAGKPVPGLTDAQNANALALCADGKLREAQQYVQSILEPSVKKTLL